MQPEVSGTGKTRKWAIIFCFLFKIWKFKFYCRILPVPQSSTFLWRCSPLFPVPYFALFRIAQKWTNIMSFVGSFNIRDRYFSFFKHVVFTQRERFRFLLQFIVSDEIVFKIIFIGNVLLCSMGWSFTLQSWHCYFSSQVCFILTLTLFSFSQLSS